MIVNSLISITHEKIIFSFDFLFSQSSPCVTTFNDIVWLTVWNEKTVCEREQDDLWIENIFISICCLSIEKAGLGTANIRLWVGASEQRSSGVLEEGGKWILLGLFLLLKRMFCGIDFFALLWIYEIGIFGADPNLEMGNFMVLIGISSFSVN